MLSERLALLVSLDASGAIGGLEKIGKTADRELARSQGGLDKTGKAMQKFGVGALAVGGLAAAGLWKAGQSASDLNEVVSKTSVVFGPASKKVEEFAKNAAKIGQSKRQALEAASGFGNLFVSMGLASDRSADMSVNLTGLASDLASFSNTSPEDAIQALSSALIGEAEPIRKYGVLLDDATLKQKALSLGLIDTTTGTLPPAIRAQAAYAAILEQTTTAQGDYARTADGAANQQRTLAAEMENLKAGIGAGVLPVMNQLLGTATDLAGGFSGLNAVSDGAVGKIATVGTAGLIAAGGLSFLVGKAISMRDNLGKLGPLFHNAEGGLNRLGKAGQLAGVVIGTAAMVQMGREMSKVSISTQQLERALADTSKAGEEQFKTFLVLADAEGRLDDVVRDAAESNFAGAQRMIELADAAGVASDRIGKLRDVAEDGRRVQAQAAIDQKANADAVDDATKAMGGLSGATGDVNDELKEQTELLEGLFDATLSQLDADLGYQKSQNDVEDAIKGVNDALKTNGRDSEEYQRAILDATGALDDQAEAAVKLYEDTVKASGGTLDATQRQAIFKAELERLRDTLAPNSPLRQNIQGQIDALNAIPAKKATIISADTDDATRRALLFRQLIDTIPKTVTVTLNGVTSTRPNVDYRSGYRAKGGPIGYLAGGGFPGGPMGTDTVPAWLTPGEYVINAKSASMIGRGALDALNAGRVPTGGGGGVTNVINITTGADPQAVVEAIKRYTRNNGPLPANLVA